MGVIDFRAVKVLLEVQFPCLFGLAVLSGIGDDSPVRCLQGCGETVVTGMADGGIEREPQRLALDERFRILEDGDLG